MEEHVMTTEEVLQYLKNARDSVWVINETFGKLEKGAAFDEELQRNLEANAGHLKIVVAKKEVIESGEDVSDLNEAIASAEAKLAELE